MGWDVDIINKCEHCKREDTIEVDNYTYNVNCMYARAFGTKSFSYLLNNRKCSEVIDLLQEAIKNMESDPDKYREMNPKNGWGDYEGALEFLKKILADCEKNLEGFIRIT